MDKKIAGLLGAVAALTSIDAAQAATQPAPKPAESLRAASYADLLTTITGAITITTTTTIITANTWPFRAATRSGQARTFGEGLCAFWRRTRIKRRVRFHFHPMSRSAILTVNYRALSP